MPQHADDDWLPVMVTVCLEARRVERDGQYYWQALDGDNTVIAEATKLPALGPKVEQHYGPTAVMDFVKK